MIPPRSPFDVRSTFTQTCRILAMEDKALPHRLLEVWKTSHCHAADAASSNPVGTRPAAAQLAAQSTCRSHPAQSALSTIGRSPAQSALSTTGQCHFRRPRMLPAPLIPLRTKRLFTSHILACPSTVPLFCACRWHRKRRYQRATVTRACCLRQLRAKQVPADAGKGSQRRGGTATGAGAIAAAGAPREQQGCRLPQPLREQLSLDMNEPVASKRHHRR